MSAETNAQSPINFITDEKVSLPKEIGDIQRESKDGDEVAVEGMVQKVRELGKVVFVIVQTARDHIQGVLEEENMELLGSVAEGDFIRMHGRVVMNPQAYKGTELAISKLDKVAGPQAPVPFSPARKLKLNIDQLLDHRVLTLRHQEQRAIFRVQEGIDRAFREYLTGQRFTEIHSPKVLKTGTEGGANMFKLDYFGSPAFLAQSPQFYKQFMVPVFQRVFEVAPAFRAEKHKTSRHLNEFTSLDLEMGFIDSFRDVMAVVTGFMRHMVAFLKEQYAPELEILKAELPNLDQGIPEVRFDKGKEIAAGKLGREVQDPWDIEPDEEKVLCDYVRQETGSDFVFITNFPEKKRPFYTMQSPDDPRYTEGFDLLFRGLEVGTGGQRIHDHATQVRRLQEKGLNPDDFKDFLELHRWGAPPHGGCGIGLERLTQKLLGKENVRETTLFPRDRKRLTP